MFLKSFQFGLEFGTITDCAWRALRDSDSSLCKIREFVVPEDRGAKCTDFDAPLGI